MFYYTIASNGLGILTLLFTFFFFNFKENDVKSKAETIKRLTMEKLSSDLRGTNKEIMEQQRTVVMNSVLTGVDIEQMEHSRSGMLSNMEYS